MNSHVCNNNNTVTIILNGRPLNLRNVTSNFDSSKAVWVQQLPAVGSELSGMGFINQ
jgi:hypothetical protein